MDYAQIAQVFTAFAQGGTSFVYILALAVGVVIVLSGIIDIIRLGTGRFESQSSVGSPGVIVSKMIIGALVASLGWTLQSVLGTVGDPTEVRNALAYVQGDGSNPTIDAIWAAIGAWVVLIGTAAFFRGFLLLLRASNGRGDAGDDIWRALWHVVGGAIAIKLFS